MARARKCDRCGKFYEKNLVTDKRGNTLIGVSFVEANYRYVDDKDLCDECIAKFKRFMAGTELKE